MTDNFALLGNIFAVAMTPAIVELVKRWKLPPNLSPALAAVVAMALYALGWAISYAYGAAEMAEFGDYLMTALAVSGAAVGSVSLGALRYPQRNRKEP